MILRKALRRAGMAVALPLLLLSATSVLMAAPPSELTQDQPRIFVPFVSGGGGLSECPIDADARALVEEIAFDALRDAAWSGRFAGFRERGFALSLPGVDDNYTGSASLIEECTSALSYDHYCASDEDEPGSFWTGRSKCLRLGCVASGIGIADVYLTEQPHDGPDDRHPFAYASLAPAGEIVFSQNPRLRWTYDLRDLEDIVITGTVASALSFRASDGGLQDLSHSGVITATKPQQELRDIGLSLDFPLLADQPIALALRMNEGHLDAGRITYGKRVIAAIEGRFSPEIRPDFRWFADCGGLH